MHQSAELEKDKSGLEEKKKVLSDKVRGVIALLDHNPLFARNAILYALRKKLNLDNPVERGQNVLPTVQLIIIQKMPRN